MAWKLRSPARPWRLLLRDSWFPLLGLLLLGVVWLTTWQLVRVEYDAADAAAVASSRELVETYEAHVVRALREIDQTLKVVKLAVEDAHHDRPLERLRQRDLLPPAILFQIDIVDAQGLARSSAQVPSAASVGDEPFFQLQRRADQFAVGLPRRGSEGGWRLSFSRRLNDAHGEFAGAVVLSVDAAYFVSAYEPEKLGLQGTLGLLGEDGVFRVRRVADRITAGQSAEVEILLQNLDDNDTSTQLMVNPWDGELRYTSARRLYRYPLVVLVGLSAPEQLAAADRAVARYRWMAGGASLVFLLVIAWLARMDRRLRESERRASQARVAMARQVGMAEIATNVLHNVGNVLNSVNVSAEVALRSLRNSKMLGLGRAVALMEQHTDNLGAYLEHDEKGRLLPGYLSKLAAACADERSALLHELELLLRSIDHIKEIVATQQSLAGSSELIEPVRIDELLAEAVRMQQAAIERHAIAVDIEVHAKGEFELDRHRLLSVLINLLSNAKDAINARNAEDPNAPAGQIRIKAGLIGESSDQLLIEVADNGEGLSEDTRQHMFEHGFSTRSGGRGFGLHSCALAAAELGGTLQADSAGRAQGAVFRLQIPVAHKQAGDD